jgi:hypothetical protein
MDPDIPQTPPACMLSARTREQRERRATLVQRLERACEETRELPTGYAFRLAPEPAVIMAAAEFITLERLCCPFFAFALEVGAEGGPFWLRITGDECVKDFLHTVGLFDRCSDERGDS